tara:strand:+ start:250 stop:642 length:393 start_codon:yes stop_codon:yes gene_type:complete
MKKIFTNGCFDILHRGHIELLKFCKSLGEVTVGLNSDKSVKSLKGSTRPFFTEEDRKFMLESCKYVDNVVLFDEQTPFNLINFLKPDLVVKGGDYKPQEVVGYGICEILIFKFIDGYSTTNVMERIRNET